MTNHKDMLDELLALIHRDGGQYTILCGYEVSYLDARIKIQDLVYHNREMSDALKRRNKSG